MLRQCVWNEIEEFIAVPMKYYKKMHTKLKYLYSDCGQHGTKQCFSTHLPHNLVFL